MSGHLVTDRVLYMWGQLRYDLIWKTWASGTGSVHQCVCDSVWSVVQGGSWKRRTIPTARLPAQKPCARLRWVEDPDRGTGDRTVNNPLLGMSPWHIPCCSECTPCVEQLWLSDGHNLDSPGKRVSVKGYLDQGDPWVPPVWDWVDCLVDVGRPSPNMGSTVPWFRVLDCIKSWES